MSWATSAITMTNSAAIDWLNSSIKFRRCNCIHRYEKAEIVDTNDLFLVFSRVRVAFTSLSLMTSTTKIKQRKFIALSPTLYTTNNQNKAKRNVFLDLSTSHRTVVINDIVILRSRNGTHLPFHTHILCLSGSLWWPHP